MERTAERTAKKQGEMDAFHGRKEETPDASNAEGSSVSEDGAGGGTRTHTVSPPADFESATSTNSITPALFSCCESHFSRSAVGQNFRAELTKNPFLGYTEKSIIARARPVG